MRRFITLHFRALLMLALVGVGFVFFIQPVAVDGEEYDAAPAMVQDVKVSIDNSVTLSWSEGNEWDLFSYVVSLRKATEKEAGKVLLTGLSDEYLLSDLESGQYYFVQLQARDISGNLSKKTRELGFYLPEGGEAGSFELHGWLPATSDVADGISSFRQNQLLFNSISPFEYSFGADGLVSRAASVFNGEDVNSIRESGVLVIPSITNNFDIDDVGTIVMASDELRARHIESVVSLVLENGYDGIDIDYENIKPETKDQFTDFISKLSERLHAENKVLHVTLQPKRSDDQNWRGVGAQDFAAIGRYADRVRLMSYDHSRTNSSPGSIAPIDWYKEVLLYATSLIDAEKIVAGIPTYAYRWCTKEVEGALCENDALVYSGVQKLLLQYDVEPSFSSESLTPFFTYTDDVGREFIVHYEDNQSIRAKLKLIDRLGLAGASLWRLGNEDATIYSTLKSVYISEETLSGGVSVQPGDGSVTVFFDDASSFDGYKISYNIQGQPAESVEAYNSNSYTLDGLENEQVYEIRVEPIELAVSLEDDSVAVQSQGSKAFTFTIVPGDSVSPYAIEDLKVSEVGTDSALISFSATGDDAMDGRAREYDIRFSRSRITEKNFEQAELISGSPEPGLPFSEQEIQLRNLEGGKEYYVAMRVKDEAGNVSLLSNSASFKTTDLQAPHAPEISEVVPGDEEAEVIWKAPLDDDVAGFYVYLETPDEGELPLTIGKEKNHVYIPYLKNNITYRLSLSAFDESGNESDRSIVAEIIPRSSDPFVRFSDDVLVSHEKLKGSLSSFGSTLFSGDNLPYMILFAVIVINLFLYLSFKTEMMRLLRLRITDVEEDTRNAHGTIRVHDMKKRKLS